EIKQHATGEELEKLQNLPENRDKWFELINGVIYEALMPSSMHSYIGLLIAAALLEFVIRHELGFVFGDGCNYKLPNADEVIPDVSFIARGRGVPSFKAKLELAPDLAVEVVSPGNRERAMLDKVESYLASGTKLVWLVYPTIKVVDVYRLNNDGSINIRKITVEGTLDGEDVLSGFTFPASNIFP
ncbi:MAG: Uma2 family endonuclease, partial [Anaerolineae bacterium]|nr:Uma2 family endonuclease [Anaerolineae bacterium]